MRVRPFALPLLMIAATCGGGTDFPGWPNPGGGPGLNWNCAKSCLNGRQYWTCNDQDGDLYMCPDRATPARRSCQHGCFHNGLGRDNLCVSDAPGWNCAYSRLRSNGQQYWTCDAKDGKLYRCDQGGNPEAVSCLKGCHDNDLGNNDTCN